jgi:uncharacterized protein
MLPHALQQPEFKAAIALLINKLAPAGIICFGYCTYGRQQKTCFQQYTTTHHQYDVLIVTPQHQAMRSAQYIEAVQKLASPTLSLHALVHSEQAVEQALNIGHPFFYKIFSEGIVVYTNGTGQGAPQPVQPHHSVTEASRMHGWQRPFTLAERLLATASVAIRETASYDVGVFLLHQVMEHLCIASAQAAVQYRPTTHSLMRLIDLVSCYLPQAREVFPCNTPHERELFNVLRKAYSDVRYKEGYTVPPHTASALLERVHAFKTLLENNYTATLQSCQAQPAQAPAN